MSDSLKARLATWLRAQAARAGRLGLPWHLSNGRAPGGAGVYLRLAMQLQLERPIGERGKSLLLTSPTSQRLIHETAQELAVVVAGELGQRVLLADTGGPVGGAPGVAELLEEGPARLGLLVLPTQDERVFVLPAGAQESVPAARSAAHRAELVSAACASYDCVILLGRPVLEDPRSLAFASLVDHALLLALEARTEMAELDLSLRALAERKASGVAVVLSRERPAPRP